MAIQKNQFRTNEKTHKKECPRRCYNVYDATRTSFQHLMQNTIYYFPLVKFTKENIQNINKYSSP